MRSMNTWILSMKVFLISAGVLSLAMAIKFSIPVAVNGIPTIWSVILTLLNPPYIYILINGIIIIIVATSRFHQTESEPSIRSPEQLISVKNHPPSDFVKLSSAQPVIDPIITDSADETAVVVYASEDRVVELKPVMVNGSQVDVVTEKEIVPESEGRDVFVDDSTLTYDTSPQEIISSELHYYDTSPQEIIPSENHLYDTSPQEIISSELHLYDTSQQDIISSEHHHYDSSPQEIISSELHHLESLFPEREKPLVSTRFVHRKPIRTTPEVPGGGKKLRRVARPKRHETLESTWKAITEGRHVPLTRHLKKSDTWEQHGRHVTPDAVDHVATSETFNDQSIYEPDSNSKIRKEPSLGQEELNRRVEAFIKKINDDMRKQRQESLNQHFMEMINRGV